MGLFFKKNAKMMVTINPMIQHTASSTIMIKIKKIHTKTRLMYAKISPPGISACPGSMRSSSPNTYPEQPITAAKNAKVLAISIKSATT